MNSDNRSDPEHTFGISSLPYLRAGMCCWLVTQNTDIKHLLRHRIQTADFLFCLSVKGCCFSFLHRERMPYNEMRFSKMYTLCVPVLS